MHRSPPRSITRRHQCGPSLSIISPYSSCQSQLTGWGVLPLCVAREGDAFGCASLVSECCLVPLGSAAPPSLSPSVLLGLTGPWCLHRPSGPWPEPQHSCELG
eukprot:EG_transcript_19365